MKKLMLSGVLIGSLMALAIASFLPNESNSSMALIEDACTCTYNGTSYSVGAQVCMGDTKMACEQYGDECSWAEINGDCPN